MSEKVEIDWAALVKQARPREKQAALCLRGDLLIAMEDATLLLADAEERFGHVKSLGGPHPEVKTAREDLAKAEDAVVEATVVFRMKGLSRDVYRALEAKHKDPNDAGWDPKTFNEALVRACLVEPVVGDDQPLFEPLTVGESDKLFQTAFFACNEADELPLPKRG